jgi:hypothetical protein
MAKQSISVRTVSILLLTMLPLRGWAQSSSGDPPLSYELLINGETFVIEADGVARLESQKQPGVTYEVAIRVASRQRIELKNLQFTYRWPAKVEVERRGTQRMARVEHELGYSLIVTDLGPSMDGDTKRKALEILAKSVVDSFAKGNTHDLQVFAAHEHPFQHSRGMGVVIRYKDQQDLDQVCLVYLLTTETFACSAVASYLHIDAGNVLPQIKDTLDSVRPIR